MWKTKVITYCLIGTLFCVGGCSKAEDPTPVLPTSFSTESIGACFAEDTSQAILSKFQYGENTEKLFRLFLQNFNVISYQNNEVVFNTIDSKKLIETISMEEMKYLSVQGNFSNALTDLLCEKSQLPVVSKTAQVTSDGVVYQSNKFVMEQFVEFITTVMGQLSKDIKVILKNDAVSAAMASEYLEVGNSKVIAYSADAKLCISLQEVLSNEEALNKIKEKDPNNDVSVEIGSVPVYVRYTLVNLGKESIKTPDVFRNVNSSYMVCELDKQPSGIEMPIECLPLQETLCEEFFVLDDKDASIFIVNNDELLGKVEIGGNDEE